MDKEIRATGILQILENLIKHSISQCETYLEYNTYPVSEDYEKGSIAAYKHILYVLQNENLNKIEIAIKRLGNNVEAEAFIGGRKGIMVAKTNIHPKRLNLIDKK